MSSRTLSTSRRAFLWSLGAGAASPVFAGLPAPSTSRMGDLRRAIVESPVNVASHRAIVYTRVFQANEDKPWIVCKGLALREYFQTVPLYLRPGDSIAGAISETPGAMPLMVEIGIGENQIYTSENPARHGYLKGKVPVDVWDYWLDRNLYGRLRKESGAAPPGRPDLDTVYKHISCQGHLSPSYSELLSKGLAGLLAKVGARRSTETDPEKLAFLDAAANTLSGVSEWAVRYGEFLAASDPELSRVCRTVSTQPPKTLREAMQLIWFVHQAIHIEGHGYSCSPDHIDQLLLPYYEADITAGRLDDKRALELCENFTLKMYDNTFWGPEHHLTQGLMVGGSTPDGNDLTNRLSWLFIEGATNMALPEPLIWIRWHPKLDQKFFDFCLSRLARGTCFPMMWNDKAIPEALMGLGVSREDAFRYIAVGCNELAIPGQFYFNPGANADYLGSIRKAMEGEPPGSFEAFLANTANHLRESIQRSYQRDMTTLKAQMRWGQTPLTSCFFEGCVERGRDMILGTKYNLLTCGGIFFANAVDCLAAIREVVYQKKQATLAEVAAACKANFKGHERLRAKLLSAPKHGNDDPSLDTLIRAVEAMRDLPVKQICKDPRDGSPFGNGHVVRSSAVKTGLVTPATPDGRLAGAPLASSIASSVGCERSGPTAVLNSVTKLNGPASWQHGYQVNLRFQGSMLSNQQNREKVRAMINVYFHNGGQELQVNAVDTGMLRAAQKNPELYRDLVVRIAGFSEFFVNLTPEMQEEIIARTAHS